MASTSTAQAIHSANQSPIKLSSNGKRKPESNKELIPIYTDWANHYLEKCQRPRLIKDLQKDCQDSLLLIDVIQSVTGCNIPDVTTKPRTDTQQLENVSACLRFVGTLGVKLDSINAKDICDGQLKAILSLFFALSKFKQSQKNNNGNHSSESSQSLNNNKSNPANNKAMNGPTSVTGIPRKTPNSTLERMATSKLPSPFKPGSGIPTPAGSLTNSPARSLADRKKASNSQQSLTSHSRSPSVTQRLNSGIPTPGTVLSKSATSGIKAPTSTGISRIQPPSTNQSPRHSAIPPGPSGQQQNGKMLEKFRLFSHNKDKSSATSSVGSTASSSGISSAKSDTTSTTSTGNSQSTSASNSGIKPPNPDLCSANSGLNSPRNALRAFAAKRGLKSPKTPSKISKVKDPEVPGSAPAKSQDSVRKVSGCAQTSPQLTHDVSTGTSQSASSKPVGLTRPKTATSKMNTNSSTDTSKNRPTGSDAEDTDADSAYAGGGSASISPTSSNAPSEASRQSEPAASSMPVKCPTTLKTGVQRKPVLAVKGITNVQSPTTAQPAPAPAPAPSIPVAPIPVNKERIIPNVTEQTNSPTVGVVSPMTHHKTTVASNTRNTQKRESTESMLSDGRQSDSNSSQSKDSDAVSVIYRHASPNRHSTDESSANTSCDSVIAAPGILPNSRLETTFGADVTTNSDSPSDDSFIQPMMPLVPHKSPFAHAPIGKAKPPTGNMKQNGAVCLSTGASPAHHQLGAVRCAAGEGYVSDGDALGTALAELTAADMNAGYMSEGGITLYARKMQARFREGLEAVRDSVHKPAHDCFGDSFEDSSSLSSGLSVENIDDISTDDLTGSSLSDAYGTHQYHHNHKQSASMHPRGSHGQKAQGRQIMFSNSNNANPLQQRKIVEQGQIDLLLQKCRTSARGSAVVGHPNQPANRPKSEQMNQGPGHVLSMAPSHQQRGVGPGQEQAHGQLSADGQYLRMGHLVQGQGVPHHALQQPHKMYAQSHGTPTLGPRSRTAMQILREHQQRAQSQQPNGTAVYYDQPPQFAMPPGYHSLDRKRHLLNGYYSETEQNVHNNYRTMPHSQALALLSPRRVPPNMQDNGPPTQQRWSTNAPQNGAVRAPPTKPINADQRVSPTSSNGSGSGSMSRSLYHESSMLKLSATTAASVDVDKSPCKQTLAHGLEHANDYHHQQQRSSVHTDGIYANLIQRTNCGSKHDHAQTFNHPCLSPTHSTAASAPASSRMVAHHSPYLTGVLNRVGVDGNRANAHDNHHNSQLSLASNSSSMYSNTEEKYQSEIRKLQREIEAYKDKVRILQSQKSGCAPMVQPFEKALGTMQKRVETLQSAASQKDASLLHNTTMTDLRGEMSQLRHLSAQAGILIDDNQNGLNRRHTFNEQASNGSSPPGSHTAVSTHSSNDKNSLQRQPSCESMLSTFSQRSSKSSSSKSSKATDKNSVNGQPKPFGNKRSWTSQLDAKQIRSSLTKAFKPKKGDASKCAGSDTDDLVMVESGRLEPIAGSGTRLNEEGEEMVVKLRQQLLEKEGSLTEYRLGAITSAHQIDHLKEQNNKLRAEVALLRQKYEQLRVSHREPHGSQTSLPFLSDGEGDSVSDYAVSDRAYLSSSGYDGSKDVRRVSVSVHCCENGYTGRLSPPGSAKAITIGSVVMGARTSWNSLDIDLAKLFNEYLHKLDPVNKLNLSSDDSLFGYWCGQQWHKMNGANEHCANIGPLKCAAEQNTVQLVLKGICQEVSLDSLSFDTLVPKDMLARWLVHLNEQDRLILFGAWATGKTYLAQRIADFVINSSVGVSESETVPKRVHTIVCNDANTDLQHNVEAIAEIVQLCNTYGGPMVLIVDDLHQKTAGYDSLLAPLNHLQTKHQLFVIGTMNQTNVLVQLQINHNFRFMQWDNNIEPVKHLLSRYLRRKLIQTECQRGSKLPNELVRLVDFLPKLWLHINEFLKTTNCMDTSIGPRWLFACPMDIVQSRGWFVQLWNKRLIPYLMQAAKQAIECGRSGQDCLEDPTDYVCEHWPWSASADGSDMPDRLLSRVVPHEIMDRHDHKKYDPLMMLMKLQEERNRPDKAASVECK